jgi:hypothetical protein
MGGHDVTWNSWDSTGPLGSAAAAAEAASGGGVLLSGVVSVLVENALSASSVGGENQETNPHTEEALSLYPHSATPVSVDTLRASIQHHIRGHITCLPNLQAGIRP